MCIEEVVCVFWGNARNVEIDPYRILFLKNHLTRVSSFNELGCRCSLLRILQIDC